MIETETQAIDNDALCSSAPTSKPRAIDILPVNRGMPAQEPRFAARTVAAESLLAV